MLQKMARDFAAQEIIPQAAHFDQTAEFPIDIIDKGRRIGLVNLNIPEEYGGPGASVLDECIVGEELAYGCSGISTAMSVNNLSSLPIRLAGTEEQHAYWLGERMMEQGDLAAYCVTEPGAGSNVAGMQTRAEKQGDHYLINGGKIFISNVNYASFYTVFALTDPAARHRGISCFIVERDSPGITVSRHFDKLGQRAADTAEITFENVEVPEANRIGAEGQGFMLAMQVFDHSRPGVAAGAVGVARRALEESVKYAKERETFGQPIWQHQAVGHKIADMAINVEAARLAGVAGGVAGRSRGEQPEGGRLRQSLRRRHGDAGDGRCGAGLRRLRLHEGVPGREADARRQGLPDLRRHQRNPAQHHRARIVPIRRKSPEKSSCRQIPAVTDQFTRTDVD